MTTKEVTTVKTKEAVTIEELTVYARKYLEKEYGLTLDVPVIRNNRLRTTMGSLCASLVEGVEVAHSIEIAGYVMKYGAKEAIIDLLEHELIHYALYTLGKPYQDGDDYFENELREKGVGATNTNFIGPMYKSTCSKCKKSIESGRKFKDYSRVVSRCCRAKVTEVTTVMYDGTEGM